MKERIAKSLFWLVWSKGGIQIVGLISTLFIARLLAPADYGLMALAGVWIFPISLLAEMGLGSAIVQFRDLDERDLNSCFWLTMILALIGYVFLFLLAPFVAVWFRVPALTNVLRVGALTLPLVAVRVVPDSLLRKRLALDKVSQAEFIGAVVTIPIMLILAWNGAGVWTLVAGALVAPLVQSTLICWFLRWSPGWKVRGKRFNEVWKYSVSSLAAKVCWALYREADTVVLGKVSGEVILGFYTMAKQLASMPVDKISTVVNQLASPIMAELQDNREAMQAYLIRGLRLVACLTLPMCIGMIFTAHDVVQLVLTEKWTAAVPALQILCLFAAIRSIDILLPSVLMARFRARFLFGYAFALLAVMPLAFLMGSLWHGAAGVALAWILIYPPIMARMAHETFCEVGLTWRSVLKQISPPIAASVSMAIVLCMLGWGLSAWSNDLAFARLFITVVLGAMAYIGSLILLDAAIWRELKEVFDWSVRRTSPLAKIQEQIV